MAATIEVKGLRRRFGGLADVATRLWGWVTALFNRPAAASTARGRKAERERRKAIRRKLGV